VCVCVVYVRVCVCARAHVYMCVLLNYHMRLHSLSVLFGHHESIRYRQFTATHTTLRSLLHRKRQAGSEGSIIHVLLDKCLLQAVVFATVCSGNDSAL
jgi:hypothetical protein